MKKMVWFLYAAFSGLFLYSPLLLSSQTSQQWSLIAGLGYGKYSHTVQSTGKTAFERLGISFMLPQKINRFSFGIETAIQSGARMQLDVSQNDLDVLGGLPIQINAKPILDFLVVSKRALGDRLPISLAGKGGLAYVEWQTDRNTVNNLSKVLPEVQFGLNYEASKHVNLNLMYQRIFGSNPNFSVNALSQRGIIATISTVQAIYLGIQIR